MSGQSRLLPTLPSPHPRLVSAVSQHTTPRAAAPDSLFARLPSSARLVSQTAHNPPMPTPGPAHQRSWPRYVSVLYPGPTHQLCPNTHTHSSFLSLSWLPLAP